MAQAVTKTQAKIAIDNAAVQVKADIDNTLPVGVDIVDASITFGPTRWVLVLNAVSMGAAETLITNITTNLTTTGRAFTVERSRRVVDGVKQFIISTTLATYRIINF